MAKKIKKLSNKKKVEILNSESYVTITSREIAEMTGKEHYDVLKDVRRISSEINFPLNNRTVHAPSGRSYELTDIFFEHYYQVGGKGKRYPMYVLGQFMADMVLTSYSAEYRAVLLRELYARRQIAQQWHESRTNLRHEHWELTGHIKRLSEPNEAGEVLRDCNGKRLVMRYSTELDMMNLVVLGVQSKKFKSVHGVEHIRDAMTPEQIYLMDRVQKHNVLMLELNVGYYARKGALQTRVPMLVQNAPKSLVS